MNKKEWTNEEIDVLKRHTELKISRQETAQLLGRSVGSVIAKASKLGLKINYDLTGQTFGMLTVIGRDYNNPNHKRVYWKCRCSCENKTIVSVSTGHLQSGHTKSCGCLYRSTLNSNLFKKQYNKYDLDSFDYGVGYDSDKNKFIFDKEDYEKIKDICWHKTENGYFAGSKDNKIIYMHRFIMGCPQGMQVDHIHHNRWDNRKSELRICTDNQNKLNSKVKKHSKSGVLGVYQYDDKYVVQLRKNNVIHYIGTFKNIEDAKEARRKAEKYYYQDFAPDHDYVQPNI